MSFSNIIGNEKIKNILIKSISNNTVLHSYMFIGADGIGKKMIAKQFAKMILCENSGVGSEESLKVNLGFEECDNCKSCVEFNSGNNPDFICIEPDGKNIKIDQIREMQTKVVEKPVNSKKKIYIIDNADLMTKEAQNCLLKTLEEPPEYIVIILIVSNESKILTTIKSRCMKLFFDKISDEEIRNILVNNCDIENINDNIIKLCDGSIGKCFSVKEKIDDYNQIENIFLKINNSLSSVINSAELLYKNKDNINDYLEYINVILYRFAKEKHDSIKYINSIKTVENVKKRLLANSNYDMCIDYLLFNIWEEINEKNNRS